MTSSMDVLRKNTGLRLIFFFVLPNKSKTPRAETEPLGVSGTVQSAVLIPILNPARNFCNSNFYNYIIILAENRFKNQTNVGQKPLPNGTQDRKRPPNRWEKKH
uniref:Uncharacterized protein n=1 Tax=Cacopsylla melanoneura TaxID=428564 RepID=A0A8D8VSE3_9HEMI